MRLRSRYAGSLIKVFSTAGFTKKVKFLLRKRDQIEVFLYVDKCFMKNIFLKRSADSKQLVLLFLAIIKNCYCNSFLFEIEALHGWLNFIFHKAS